MIDVQESANMWSIFLHGELVCGFACLHVAKKASGVLSEAREA